VRLTSVTKNVAQAAAHFGNSNCDLGGFGRQILNEVVGKPSTDVEQLTRVWQRLLTELSRLRSLELTYVRISETCAALSKAGAPAWAERLKVEIATSEFDPAAPPDWKEAWNWAFQLGYLEKIGAASDLGRLHAQRLTVEKE
jgi:hypothetical protein